MRNQRAFDAAARDVERHAEVAALRGSHPRPLPPIYGTADEARLRFIKSAQRVGLNLGEIKETLAFRERGEPPCEYVASVIERRLGEVNQRLRELRTFKRELTEVRDQIRAAGPAPERDGAYCHYIQSAAAEAGVPQTAAASS